MYRFKQVSIWLDIRVMDGTIIVHMDKKNLTYVSSIMCLLAHG